MEIVGAVASIVTLVALAKEVWTLSTKLLNDCQNAPEELFRISNETFLIFHGLESISLSNQDHGLFNHLTKDEVQTLEKSLAAAKVSLETITHLYSRHIGDKKRTLARLSWSFFDHKTVKEHLVHLQRTESSFCVILHVISIRANRKAHDENSRQNEIILDLLQLCHNNLGNQGPMTIQTGKHDNEASRMTTFQFKRKWGLPSSWASALNCEFQLCQSRNEFQKAYELYARFPIFWFGRQKAFVLSTSLRTQRTFLPNWQLLNGSLNCCNVISEEADIVKACQKGDLIAVRDLFKENNASPNDVTADNKSLVWYATESGSFELVQFLLSAGAPVRAKILHAASYYRQPQIARLLVHSGADIDAFGDDGFTSASFLFGYAGQSRVPQTEFLQMLASNSFSNFNSQDVDGWSVLHRAATFGTAADILCLVRMGTSLHSRTQNLNWTPIFCAVCFSNLETLEELWKLHDDTNMKNAKDLRGWNFLHIAAGAGNFEAIPYLLAKGVDLNAFSNATSRSVPPSLRDKSVTPTQVARNCGEVAYGKWVDALKLAGQDIEPKPEDIDWTIEVHDGIFGGCECCKSWKL